MGVFGSSRVQYQEFEGFGFRVGGLRVWGSGLGVWARFRVLEFGLWV